MRRWVQAVVFLSGLTFDHAAAVRFELGFISQPIPLQRFFHLGAEGATTWTRYGSGSPIATVENHRVLIWDAYNAEFAPHDEGPELRQLFERSVCPPFRVTYLQDGQATVDSVRSFTEYGTVILVTHGAVDGSGQVVFLTAEPANLPSILAHALDLLLGRLSLMDDVFAIRPSFVSHLSGSFASALVYNSSCESSTNSTLANAFLAKGAKAYYGFSGVVNSSHARNVATQLFHRLVARLDSTGNGFYSVTPKADPVAPFATFTMAGDPQVEYRGDPRPDGLAPGGRIGEARDCAGRAVEGTVPLDPIAMAPS